MQNSYKKSNNNIELFKTWKESYELQYFKQGIFEANVNTYVSNEDIEKDFKQLKIKTLKEVMQNYIKELKFYSNNDFAFLEVHNKELFLKNALVLKEIVELFANYKLTQNSTNQFLGNLFELFYKKV